MYLHPDLAQSLTRPVVWHGMVWCGVVVCGVCVAAPGLMGDRPDIEHPWFLSLVLCLFLLSSLFLFLLLLMFLPSP